MLVLHHLEKSRSQRIAWLLEELGVPYDVKIYERDEKTMLAPQSLRDVHPLGKSPVVTDGDKTIAESGAIIEYLLDSYDDGSLRPAAGSEERRDFTFWLHYAEGSFMPLMLLAIVLRRIDEAPLPFFIKPVAKGITGKVREGFLNDNIRRHVEFIASSLESQRWFAGTDFSAADIQMSYCLEAVESRVELAKDFPQIGDFLGRIRDRDAYQRAEERVGSFSLPG